VNHRDILILLTYTERSDADDFRNTLAGLDKEEHWGRIFDTNLLKARIAFLFGRNDEVSRYLKKAVSKAPRAFSDPFWDDGNDTIFLEKHVSRYLPAWNMLTSDHVKDNEASDDKGGFYMIKRLRPDQKDGFPKLNKREWKNKESKAKDEDLKVSMGKHPEALTLICHGHGDILNPLKSWLELDMDSRMSVLDILKFEAKL